MMTHDDVKLALKEACVERLKKQFGALADNLFGESSATAKQQFINACRNDIQALDIASGVIDQMFKG